MENCVSLASTYNFSISYLFISNYWQKMNTCQHHLNQIRYCLLFIVCCQRISMHTFLTCNSLASSYTCTTIKLFSPQAHFETQPYLNYGVMNIYKRVPRQIVIYIQKIDCNRFLATTYTHCILLYAEKNNPSGRVCCSARYYRCCCCHPSRT